MTSAFDPTNLSDAEEIVVDCAVQGERADFDDGSRWPIPPRSPSPPRIRAEVIRRLVLGLGIGDHTEIGRLAAGVRIKGCTVDGKIDLRSARVVTGESANGLELENCEIDAPDKGVPAIDARGAVIDRLALTDCVAHGVDFSSSHIRGDAMFVGLRGKGQPSLAPAASQYAVLKRMEQTSWFRSKSVCSVPGECWIRGNRSRIDGRLDASGAILFAPRLPADSMYQDREEWYAFSLRSSHIGLNIAIMEREQPMSPGSGGQTAQTGFVANGGVDIHYANVGGAVDASGAIICAPYYVRGQLRRPALDAHDARIGGAVHLFASSSMPLKSYGWINFKGARVGGSFCLWGAGLMDGLVGPAWIGADLTLGRRGEVTTIVDSDYPMEPDDTSGQVWAATPGVKAELGLSTCSIDGNVNIHPINGPTDLRVCTIGGNLALHGAVFNSVNFKNVKVGGDIQLDEVIGLMKPADKEPGSVEDKQLKSKIVLEQGKCGGGLDVTFLSREGEHILARHLDVSTFYQGWSLVEFARQVVSANKEEPAEGVVYVASFLYQAQSDAQATEVTPLKIVQLNGNSDVVHELNELLKLDLIEEVAVAKYLTFFCAYIWGPEGAFLLRKKLKVWRGEGLWKATAEVRYGTDRFQAWFKVQPNGQVEMTGDELLDPLDEPATVIYDDPVRVYRVPIDASAWPRTVDEGLRMPMAIPESGSRSNALPVKETNEPDGQEFDLTDTWCYLDTDKSKELIEKLKLDQLVMLSSHPATLEIDLTALQAGGLSDDSAGAWWRNPETAPLDPLVARLWLNGFEYGRIMPHREAGKPAEGKGIKRDFKRGTDSDGAESSRGAHSTHQIGRLKRWLPRLQNTWAVRFGMAWARRFGFLIPFLLLLGLYFTAGVLYFVAAVIGWLLVLNVPPLTRLLRQHPDTDDVDVDLRLKWLHLDSDLDPERVEADGSRSHLSPQPYEHLARVLRAEGELSKANKVTLAKLGGQRIQDSPVPRYGKFWLLELPFKWGLSVGRATLTVVILVFVGWMGTEVANYGTIRLPPIGTQEAGLSLPFHVSPVLMAQLNSVDTVANEPSGSGRIEPVVAPVAVPQPVSEIRCLDQVETLLYAFDVFVPLLDLHQEDKCEISANEDAWGWRLAKGVYAVVGWYAISMFILTASGLLRRNVET